MILITDPTCIIGKEVMHNGSNVGTVQDIKPNMEKGRRYALVKPHDATDDVRRLPLDELDLVS